MKFQIIRIFIQLIIFDINIWVISKGMQVDKIDSERKCKLSDILYSKVIKKTKIHYSVIIINLLMIFLEIVSEFAEYEGTVGDFGQAMTNVANQVREEQIWIFVWPGLIGALTILFMAISYRAVGVKPIKDDTDGNRRLSASEIDKEYIDFSSSNRIDGHSTLLLIAGDLSFLGDIPDIKDIKTRMQRKCRGYLVDNSTTHKCCKNKRCPLNKKTKCIEQSEQFEQLFELRRRGITLHIICKQPNLSNDILYKRRLGRLKKIFTDNIDIHFLPKDSVENGICVLGRIKVNGGIKELFWHWKDPENPGTYIVPNTKKVDSSENKTLIYLLETLLWDSGCIVDSESIDKYVEEYEKAIVIE